jgi:predicted HicB family RNase H-like nuclease
MARSKSETSPQATIIRLDPSVHKALRIAAIEEGITMNEAIKQAVELWLKQRARTVRKGGRK